MQAKRRPVKSVYGKAKVTQKSDLLWEEAISASPIVRKVVTIPAEDIATSTGQALHVSEISSVKKSVPEPIANSAVLQPKDPNTSKIPKRVSKGTSDTQSTRAQDAQTQTGALQDFAHALEDVTSSKSSADDSPLFDPLRASTPIQSRTSQSLRKQELTHSHIRFDSSDLTHSGGSSDGIDSESDDLESLPSDLSSVTIEHESDIEGLTGALSNLTTRQHLSLDLADESTIAEEEELSDIHTLLSLCDQTEAHDFATYVRHLEDILTLRKLGEASFSEVFLGKNEETQEETVYKVIPFGDHENEVPINDIVQEVRISRAMSSLRGYVTMKSVVVVRGVYPSSLLKLWDDWQAEFGSESDRPDKYDTDQRYCVIALEHGGVDLEHCKISCWKEARYIFEQIVETLTSGEQEKQFEHRDLHWGNILIRDTNDNNSCRVTIIDYTLSRALVRDQLSDIAFYGFSDRAIFEAEGEDYQFDIYRLMRDSITDGQEEAALENWASFHPTTNVLWLHYLVDKMLHGKGLKRPGLRKTKRNPTVDEVEIAAWKMLTGTWNLLNPRRSYNHDECAIDSAEKVLVLINSMD